METKICAICKIEKEKSLFAKWKGSCKSCLVNKNKEWKEKNKKIIKNTCLDCGVEYDTIIYSTQIPNNRCRKCSIRSKIPVVTEKECRVCRTTKSVDEYYKNYRTCKKCLFEKRNKRYNQRLKDDTIFKIRHNIKVNLKRHFKSINDKKDDKTINILGCTYKFFISYLESKFETWMNWDNYGLYNGDFNYGWDMDHKIPISSAKNKDMIKQLYHYTNFQPLCSKINRDIKKDNYKHEN